MACYFERLTYFYGNFAEITVVTSVVCVSKRRIWSRSSKKNLICSPIKNLK